MKADAPTQACHFAYNLAALGVELRRDGEQTVNGYGPAMTPPLQAEIDRRAAALIQYVPELLEPHGCVRSESSVIPKEHS